MFSPAEEFEALMQRIRAGDPEAARELFELYGKHIQRVVRRRLGQPLRSQFDSLDFAQDAWASFFHIPPERINFQTPDDLLAFLSRLAQNKLIDQYRKRCRTIKRNRHDAVTLKEAVDNEEEPLSRQPTPSQIAVAEDQWQLLLQNKSQRARRALEMLRAGHSYLDVSECLGLHPKLIQRFVQRLNPQVKT